MTTQFTRLEAIAIPYEPINVDTDQIVPARFLKYSRADGYGKFLFHDLRFDAEGLERPDFVLNQPSHRNARILIADANFGCGSSRESAVWALHGFGFRTVIASSFGDIFFENCFKNGLLLVALPEADLIRLRANVAKQPLAPIQVDLDRMRVDAANNESFTFSIDPFRREILLLGLDDIGVTLQHAASIDAFEKQRAAQLPWL